MGSASSIRVKAHFTWENGHRVSVNVPSAKPLSDSEEAQASSSVLQQPNLLAGAEGSAEPASTPASPPRAPSIDDSLDRIFGQGSANGQNSQGAPTRATNMQADRDIVVWSQNRKLTWADFQGEVDQAAKAIEAAKSRIAISLDMSCGATSKLTLTAEFEKGNSWVKPGETTDRLLRHEQTHFDIVELFRRRLDKTIRQAGNACGNRELIASRYKENDRALSDEQARYDAETKHGTDLESQQQWTERVLKALKEQ